MSTIKKNKKQVISAVSGVLPLAATVVPMVSQTVSADETVIHTSEAGSGTTKYGSKATVSNEAKVNEINSAIENFAAQNPNVKISDKTIDATDATVGQTETALATLKAKIAEFNRLKAEIDTQAADSAQFNPDSPETQTVTVDGTSYATVLSDLDKAIASMATISSNNKIAIQKMASEAQKNNGELDDAIRDANAQVSQAARTLNHSGDGAIGNYDDINRAAEDSKKDTVIKTAEGTKQGVVVDTTKTEQGNAVTTTTTASPEKVSSIEDLEAKKSAALKAIEEARKNNESLTVKADEYRDTSLHNINDINEWLQTEQDRADNIQSEIEKNSTSLSNLQAYKDKYIKALTDLKATVQSSGKTQAQIDKTIEKIDTAIATLNSSEITQNVTDTITTAENVDFGNIGRPTSEVDQIEADTTAKIDQAVDAAIVKLVASNNKINADMKPVIDENSKEMDDFISKVSKGQTGSQVSEDWLKTRPIYQQSASYRQYIKNAFSQTENGVNWIFSEKDDDTPLHLKATALGEDAAAVAAQQYQDASARGFDQGFGSPMVPSLNANDFMDVVGTTWMNSKTFAGGAQGIVNALTAKYGDGVSPSAVLQDIQNQHINVVGNENVFLVVSKTKDYLTFELDDSYVYTNADGETKTTSILLNSAVRNELGNNVVSTANAAAPGKVSGAYYLYYFSVDPDTGQLITGGGYMLTGGSRDTSNGEAGGGEMRLTSPNIATQAMTLTAANTSAQVRANLENLKKAATADAAQAGIGAGYVWSKPNSHIPKESQVTSASQVPYRLGADTSLYRLAGGVRLHFEVFVNTEAAAYAVNSPLYISDIDDGQTIYTEKDSEQTAILGGSSIKIYPRGQETDIKPTDNRSNIAAKGSTTMDSQSFMLFGGKQGGVGMLNMAAGIGKAAGSRGYSAVDVGLFAPFGIIGEPQLEIDPFNATLDTFDMSDPSAIAHTDAHTGTDGLLKAFDFEPETNLIDVNGVEAVINLAKLQVGAEKEKIASSNTALVVRKFADEAVRTASGNSMKVTTRGSDKRTASGSSLHVKTIGSSKRVASGNAVLVRQIDKIADGSVLARLTTPVATVTAPSGQPVAQATTPAVVSDKATAAIAAVADNGKPAVVSNTANGTKVELTVYSDQSILSVAKESLQAWADALAEKGVSMDITLSTDKADLEKGVTFALFAADNETTRLDKAVETIGVTDDAAFEFSELAGLSMTTSNIALADAEADDKFNRDGSVMTGKALKNAKYIIQLNTEAVTDVERQKHVMTHEMGHLFGLVHDDDDSLMATYYDDPDFTGEISERDKTLAAAYILGQA